MLHAPHVQLKAQEELARVIGNDRLPVLEDREALPYITAITKETYRWELGSFGISLHFYTDFLQSLQSAYRIV